MKQDTQGSSQIVPPGRRAGTDWATLVGLVLVAALIVATLLAGGTVAAFLDLRAVLIVVLGTAAVAIISFPPRDLAALPAAMRMGLFRKRRASGEMARWILAVAEESRREGTLAVAQIADHIRGDAFAARALGLVADSGNSAEITSVLEAERDSRQEALARSAAVLRRSGEVAPSMGLIGTLIGLVQLLGGLEDPSSIGPAMAVALLTTLYGAVLGHVILNPLASKIELAADEEARLDHLYLLGASSMARQENPRRLETLLNAALPPSERVRYFD